MLPSQLQQPSLPLVVCGGRAGTGPAGVGGGVRGGWGAGQEESPGIPRLRGGAQNSQGLGIRLGETTSVRGSGDAGLVTRNS